MGNGKKLPLYRNDSIAMNKKAIKPESDSVRKMFSTIAPKYDRANRILSFGIDIYWRKVLVNWVAQQNPTIVIDLATGSGDVAFALQNRLAENTRVEGFDFCPKMLEQAITKNKKHPMSEPIRFSLGDCLDLPIENQSVDALTIAFGFRNLENRPKGLKEMLRVLRPNGSLFILEFTQPESWFRPFYAIYLKYLLPKIAVLSTGNQSAYHYLSGTIEQFPHKQKIKKELENAGFKSVVYKTLTAGTVAIHFGKKPPV